MSCVAIIPARGGSKRIPKKNIKDFLGKPIIAYSIGAALDSGLFNEVIVSTDSEEIAIVAREYGASVPFMRSKKNADDYATTADVILEVLDSYSKQGQTFNTLCCIYPTAPFVTPEKLHEAIRIFQKYSADALVPVVPFSYPPLRGLIIENSNLRMKWPENINVRSQDLDTIYHDSGQFYFVRVESFVNEKTLLCNKAVAMVLRELEVQDIDDDADWELAELKYRLLFGENV